MYNLFIVYLPPTTLQLSQSAFHGVPRPDVVALVLLVMGLQIVWQHTPKWRENLWRQSIPVKKRLSVQCIIYFL